MEFYRWPNISSAMQFKFNFDKLGQFNIAYYRDD